MQCRHRSLDWAPVQDGSSPSQTSPNRRRDVTFIFTLSSFSFTLLLGLPPPAVPKTKAIHLCFLHPKPGQLLQPAIVRLCKRTQAVWSAPSFFAHFRNICFFRVHHRFFADQSRCRCRREDSCSGEVKTEIFAKVEELAQEEEAVLCQVRRDSHRPLRVRYL